MLDADIRALIGSTKIRYTPGNGNTTMGTLDRAVFLLSAYELGKNESWFNKEGTTLPNATNYQIAKLNGSTVVSGPAPRARTAPTTPSTCTPMAMSAATSAPTPAGPAPLSLSPPTSM